MVDEFTKNYISLHSYERVNIITHLNDYIYSIVRMALNTNFLLLTRPS